MAVQAQRLTNAIAEKAFKDIKRKQRLRQIHSDCTSLPSPFPLSQQTLQGKCLLQLMLFSSIHDTGEVLVGPLSQNKYCNCINCVIALNFFIECGSHAHTMI